MTGKRHTTGVWSPENRAFLGIRGKMGKEPRKSEWGVPAYQGGIGVLDAGGVQKSTLGYFP